MWDRGRHPSHENVSLENFLEIMQKTIVKGIIPIERKDCADNVPREYSESESRIDYRTIRVFDGFGNELQPTYRRRANGFVKHGRAQWCDSDGVQDSIILLDRFKESASESEDLRFADYLYNTEDTEMSEYRENEIIETDRETAAKIARANLEIRKAAVDALANMQIEIISGLNDNVTAGNIGCWYKDLYDINVSALKDLAQDNKPEKVVEPSIEKAVLDIKMNFVRSSLDMIKSWKFRDEISNEEYFKKSEELLGMLDKIAADAKVFEAQLCGNDDDADEVTEE